MTRGVIVFIDKDGSYYKSIEFNGDMHTYNHGKEIIEKYRMGKIVTKSDFIKFVHLFDRNHFYYAENGYEIVHSGRVSDGKLELMLIPDFFYIINHSGEKIIFTCISNTFEIEDQAMTITYFEELKQIVNMEKPPKVLISKNRFCEIIESLKAAHDFVGRFDELVREYKDTIHTGFMDGAGLAISHDELVIELLETILNDKEEMIDYFIYETNYGRKFQMGDVTDENGCSINISTAGDLYDYLMSGI